MDRFLLVLNAAIWVCVAVGLAMLGWYLTRNYRQRNQDDTDDDVIGNLHNLKESGALTEEEFRVARSTMLQQRKRKH